MSDNTYSNRAYSGVDSNARVFIQGTTLFLSTTRVECAGQPFTVLIAKHNS